MDADKEYTFKCIYLSSRPKRAASTTSTSSNVSEMVEEDKASSGKSEEGTGSKEMKFMLQVYAVDVKGFEHMVDVQLLEGHPLAFISLANRLYSQIAFLCHYH